MSTDSRFKPNALASVAASANISGDIPKETTIDEEAVAISFNTALAEIADLFWRFIAFTVSTVFDKTPSVSSPWILASNDNWEASFTPRPSCLVNMVIVIRVSPPKSESKPVDSAKSTNALFKSLDVIKISEELAAASAKLFWSW